MADPTSAAIEDYLVEDRTFPPPPEFVTRSLVTGTAMYDEANDDYEAFWARQAAELVSWSKDWHTVCEWELPFATTPARPPGAPRRPRSRRWPRRTWPSP